MVADSVYLTPSEWQAMATGIDFTDFEDADLEALIARASVLAETEANLPRTGSFLETEYENEQHSWRPASRSVYLYNWPVVSVEEMRLRVTPTTTVDIPTTEVYINNTRHYIEVSYLAVLTGFGIAPELANLGLMEPTIEVDYTAGYATIPQDIKEAVAMIASMLLLSNKLFAEGTVGVVAFAIGSYQVSFANNKMGGPAGLSELVPEQARRILRGYNSGPYVR